MQRFLARIIYATGFLQPGARPADLRQIINNCLLNLRKRRVLRQVRQRCGAFSLRCLSHSHDGNEVL